MRPTNWLRWKTLLFPLAVFAFLAPTVSYVNQIFSTNVRWAVVALLAVYLLTNNRLFMGFYNDVGRALLLLFGWALATVIWSQVPLLSFMKAGAFVLVAVTMVSAGYAWVRNGGIDHGLNYLLPVVVLALFAAGLGPSVAPSGGMDNVGGKIELYRGLIDNSNMLGSLMAMAVPLLLWRVYRSRIPRVRLLWILVLAGVSVALLMSNSRAALLATLITGFGMLFTLGLRRRLRIAVGALLTVAITLAASPSLWDTVVERYVYKGASQEQGVIYTRETVWEESWELALAGGWVGAGYGVTIGDTGFAGGLTAVGYGREKGNTQMAIMEETGIIGLALYAGFLAVLFRQLTRAFSWVRSPDDKVLIGILIGALLGFTVQGLFEAWWVAPGSPEAAYWWALVGVSVGVTLELRRRVRLRSLIERSTPRVTADFAHRTRQPNLQ